MSSNIASASHNAASSHVDPGSSESPSPRKQATATYHPRVDVWQSSEEVILLADMPGVTTETLDIQFEDRELRIHGKVAARPQDLHLVHSEYGVGDFVRSFSIGEEIDAKGISAELRDGVLTVRLPKTEAVRPRKINVKSAA